MDDGESGGNRPGRSSGLVVAVVIAVGLVAAVAYWRHTTPFERCVRASMAQYGTTEQQAVGLCGRDIAR